MKRCPYCGGTYLVWNRCPRCGSRLVEAQQGCGCLIGVIVLLAWIAAQILTVHH